MTKSKKFLIYILLMLALFLAGSVLAILSFRTGLFAGMDVFFYRGIALILLWGAVAALYRLDDKLIHSSVSQRGET